MRRGRLGGVAGVRRREKNAADPMDDGSGGVWTSGAISGCVSSPPIPQVAVATKPWRVLAARTSRERSPRRVADQFRAPSPSLNTGAVATAAGEVFAEESFVELSCLASRLELNCVHAIVLSFDDVGGRYPVRLSTGEDIRLRGDNMKRLLGRANMVQR